MPELPEVETVVRGLRPTWEGNTLSHVDVRRLDLRWPFPQDFAQRLTGRTVKRLYRRAKYILADMDDGVILLIHLGMTGRILVNQAPLGQYAHEYGKLEKHDHVVFKFQDDSLSVYNDVRRFGAMDLFTQGHTLLDTLGVEPLEAAFTPAVLADILSARKALVKSVLLNQNFIVGLGNIYVCEALFQAGIHPSRPANTVTATEIPRLHHAIQDVLQRAITAGGSTLNDYKQSDGSLGYFQHTFSVYGRTGDPCPTCQTPITRIAQSGRSSFFCDACQG